MHGPAVKGAGLQIQGPWVQAPSSAMLVNSQLVCLLPVGIFNPLCFIRL